MRSNPFAYGEITMWKGVLFLRKDDVKPGGPTQMVLGVALGGVVAIVAFAFLLSHLFGITGVWLAFPATELIAAVLGAVLYLRSKSASERKA